MTSTTDAAANVHAQAVYMLRTSAIVRQHASSSRHPLAESDAKLAVAALAAAGLLRDVPAIPTPPPAPLTTMAARVAFDQRRNEPKYRTIIAAVGTTRLQWNSASGAYQVTSYKGELYEGRDLDAAVAAYNAATR